MNARQLVFCAMSVALASVLSMLKVYEFPFGGAVTLCSMLFICLPGYFYGLGAGLLSATAYGVLQFLLGPYILFPIQIIVDYLLAFGAFGLSGLFAKSRRGLLKGYLIGILGRYVFSVLSGWLFSGNMRGQDGVHCRIHWYIMPHTYLQRDTDNRDPADSVCQQSPGTGKRDGDQLINNFCFKNYSRCLL